MPKFLVTLPDGTAKEIEAADGTTAKQLAEQIAAQIKSPVEMPKGATGVTDRFLHGLADPLYGLGQLGARAMEAVLPERLGGRWARQNRETFEGLTKEREQDYVAPDGMDWARLAGNVVGTGPAGLASGTALKAGAALGGLGAASQPIPDAGDDFWLKKGAQTAIGTGVGAATGPLAEKVVNGATGVTQRVLESMRARTGQQSGISAQDAANAMLQSALGEERWRSLSENVRRSLAKDAEAALRATGRLDPKAAKRMADFREAGIDPTKAWVTGDPVDFTKQHNAAGILPTGEKLQRAEQAAHQRMGGILDDMRGDGPVGGYQQGVRLASEVAGKQRRTEGVVGGLYDAFKREAGDTIPVGDMTPGPQGMSFQAPGSPPALGAPARNPNAQNITMQVPEGDPRWLLSEIQKRLSDDVLDLPDTWAKKLASFGDDNPLTPAEIQKLYKAANGQNARFPAEMRVVKGVLLEELDRISANAGAAQRAATGAAKSNFERQDAVRAFADAAEGGIAEEKFVEKYILSRPVKEVTRLRDEMQSNAAFMATTRTALVDTVKKAAYGEALADTSKAAFRFDAFKKWVNQDGMKEKLRLFLPKEDFKKIELLERLSRHMQGPAGNKANRSNTGAATASFALRIVNSLGRTNSLIGEMVRGAASVPANAQVGRMANAQGIDLAQRAALAQLPPELRNAIAAAVAAPAGAATINYLSK